MEVCEKKYPKTDTIVMYTKKTFHIQISPDFFGIFGVENGSLCTINRLPRICSSFSLGTNWPRNHSLS